MRIDKLRAAIRKNRISFPSQVPTFPKHDRPDLQRKLVQLYFVLGWDSQAIRERYGLSRQRFQQIVNKWKQRAVELGYLQVIPLQKELPRVSRRAPIRIVMSPVDAMPMAIGQSSECRQAGRERLPRSDAKLARNERTAAAGCRPRRKCDTSQIANVLNRLHTGRTLLEVAGEVGVSPCTIRAWKRQHEMQSLASENAKLKERLAKLSPI